MVTSPMLYRLSYDELVEDYAILRLYESDVDHWELRNFCDLASTASKTASKDAKTKLNSLNWLGLKFLPLVLRLFLIFRAILAF